MYLVKAFHMEQTAVIASAVEVAEALALTALTL
jgi:hypothetical protein